MIARITKLDNFLFFLFACWLIVDAINGVLIRGGFISVSQIYKLLVAFVLIVRCSGQRRVAKVFGFSIVFLCLYLPIVALNGENIIDSATLVSKLLTSLLFFSYFLEIKHLDEDYFFKKAYFVITCNFLVFAANMLLGNLGFGYNAYEDNEGFGSRGFFYAGNELSGVVVALFPWVLYYVKTRFSFIVYILCGAFLLFLVYTLSTKSGILATVVLIGVINYVCGNKKEKYFTFILLVFGLYYIFYKIQEILSSDEPIVQRFTFFLEKSDIFTALTSNRLINHEDDINAFTNSGFLTKVFGLGGARTIEMDPYDVLVNCGYLGLLFLVFFYIKLLVYPQNKKYKNYGYRWIVFYSNLLLVFISVIAGHILFSSMAGMLIALSNAMLYTSAKNIKPILYVKESLI